MRDLQWGNIFRLILGTIVVAGLCGAFTWGGDALSCHFKTADIGYPSRYVLFGGGCQIQVPTGWIPLDQFYYKGGPGG